MTEITAGKMTTTSVSDQQMAVRAGRAALEDRIFLGLTWISAVFVVALLVGTVYAISIVPSLHFGNGAALGVMLVAFLLAVLLGLPVSFAMLLGSLTFLLISGVAPLIAVAPV